MSLTDGGFLKNFFISGSVNSPLSISLNKFPIKEFCASNLDMSLKTISNGFCLLKTFLHTRSKA